MNESPRPLAPLPKDADPGPVPGEESTKTRRLNIALSEDVEWILRRVADRTSLSIAELRRAVEESSLVASAARQALKFRYDEWWNKQKNADDIFGGDKEA